MTSELQILLGSIAGGTGALLSYWAGWNARGRLQPPRGSYGPPPLRLRRSNPFVSEFQQQINNALNLDGYQPRSSRPGANPPPSEP